MPSIRAVASLVAVSLATTSLAVADDRIRGVETIEIHDHRAAVPPRPVKNYQRIAPAYSDYAIEHDTWARAWLLLDISESGTVTRVKLLNRPGADLDAIAVKEGFKMRFTPAQDAYGRPTHSQLMWPVEWPSYWWMVAIEGLATRIPYGMQYVPCKGSGPLHLGSVHPVYRDCTPPPSIDAAAALPWITQP